MIPTAATVSMLDRAYASPSFKLAIDLHTADDQTVHRLEQHLLDDLTPLTRDRAQTLLMGLDKVNVSPLMDLTPTRVLGRPKDPPALVQFAKDLAVWTKRTFQNVSTIDRAVLVALLETRGITLGPKGKDRLGRSTYVLQTPYGRFNLD